MKNLLLNSLLIAALSASVPAVAQRVIYMPSNVTGSPYTSLTGATAMNSSTPWDSTQSFSASIPFTFQVDVTTTPVFYLHKENGFSVDTSTNALLHGFLMYSAALVDRGIAAGTSASPITYKTEGTAPSRIFKVQVANAGFAKEYANFSTLNDFVNFQIWLYEGTNVIEMHYGTSHITSGNESLYFPATGGSPVLGYSYRQNRYGDGTLYMPAGFPTSITLDSINYHFYNVTHTGQTVLGSLDNLTIRFSPIRLGIGNTTMKNIAVYPTTSRNEIIVDNAAGTTYEVISVSGKTTGVSGSITGNSTHINTIALPTGMYLLQLSAQGNKQVYQFIKQ
ncbi:MAG: T9SS type A sorting domain-containing protein [Taibaiella sp.]|nr:T9SS type A sorting domain-containing protein [Taibaiella sp.]